MVSIFVTIHVKPEYLDKFKEISFGDAQGATRDEPGCFRFDILQSVDDPCIIYLYEVYQDESAIESHRNAPHFLKWQSSIEGMLNGDFKRLKMNTIFPSNEGWIKQKPSLLHW